MTALDSTDTATAQQVRADDRAHVFHSWSDQAAIDPLPIAGGEGAWFWDFDGNRYLDFLSQLVYLQLGHQHPKMIAAVQTQAARLCTVAPQFANDIRGEAARLITERAPGDLNKVLFTNGGADALENAVRLARLHTGRHKVFSAYRSYHGNTHAAIALTGDPRRWSSEPSVPGILKFIGPYTYRSSFHATSDAEECERALAHLDELVMFEGPDHVAAIVLEPIVGTNGVLVPPDGYLQGVRDLCDRHGIVMVADEVMSGFGRIGEWFAVDHWSVAPDLITFAKGVNSGYVPLGGVLISDAIAATFDGRVFPGGLTYSGHPLACAAAVAAIGIYEDEGLMDHAQRLGREVFGPGLADIATRHPSVGDVRGLGCFWAVELVKDRETREMLVPFNASGEAAKPMGELMAACKERGLWPFIHFNRLHLVPPIVISEADARKGLDIVDEVLAVTDAHAVA